MPPFQEYSNYYDLIYRDKDYKKESDFLEEIFRNYSNRPVKSILDLGCGTGGHALILASQGFELTGVDLSSKMLDIAKKRGGGNVNFIQGDIRKIDLKKKFDAVISMFAVIGYQTTDQELIFSFETVSKHLEEGGLFIFDCWFGPAVLNQKPQDRLKIIEKGDERIIRFAGSVLDAAKNTVDVKYKVLKVSRGRILDEVDEVHKMRFLFPGEIKSYLRQAGFELLEICPFMELDKIPTKNDWNITVIAKKL